MRDKLATLPLSELKNIAKANRIKGTSTLRKGELIEAIATYMEANGQSADAALANSSPEAAKDQTEVAAASEISDAVQDYNPTEDTSHDAPADALPASGESHSSVQPTARLREALAQSYAAREHSGYQRRMSSYTPRDSYSPRGYSSYGSRDGSYPARDTYTPRGSYSSSYAQRNAAYGQRSSYLQRDNSSYPARDSAAYGARENSNFSQRDNTSYNNTREDSSYPQRENAGYASRESFPQRDGYQYQNREASSYPYEQNTSYAADNDSSSQFQQSDDTISSTQQADAGTLDRTGSYGRTPRYAAGITPRTYPRQRFPENTESAHGILEVNSDGFGFLRSDNFLTGSNDVYVSQAMVKRFNMRTGDMVDGIQKPSQERYPALIRVNSINGLAPETAWHRAEFDSLTPVFPNERLTMEVPDGSVALRVLDLLSPIGKGQRGMIVSPPKAGKTTLLKDIAHSVTQNYPQIHLIILLIDERPEEVTDIKESIDGDNVDVIYSTFDEKPEHHKQVSEMVLERAKRLVEHGLDVMILLDSITRLARAYNLTITPSGRTLSGGLDPAALHMPKRFFGAARNMREGGSLTILATALVDTGSRMDDVVFEEFKGTGNMEVVLDRKLSERRIYPAIDIAKSGTRRDDLLLSEDEQRAVSLIRHSINNVRNEDAVERVLDLFAQTKDNKEFVENLQKTLSPTR